MKHIETNQLSVAYRDTGPSNGKPVFLLHGFPYDVHSYDVISERLSEQGFRCIIPFLRGYGPTTFKSSDILRSGQQAALGDRLAFAHGCVGCSRGYSSEDTTGVAEPPA